MPQHFPTPGDRPDDTAEASRPGWVRFDPNRTRHTSPLRRALRAAGLRIPFVSARRATPPPNPTGTPDPTTDQEPTP